MPRALSYISYLCGFFFSFGIPPFHLFNENHLNINSGHVHSIFCSDCLHNLFQVVLLEKSFASFLLVNYNMSFPFSIIYFFL